jgi:thioredoxin reductase (NADPH)
MLVVLSGEVAVTQHNVLGRDQPIVTHGPGGFMGELAQLSGRPALVDARATKPVETLVIPSHRLRDVLVAEAELGERIMRALILRRVGLLESGGGGPVIVGRAGQADVLRLEGFLARNAHPHQRLDPDVDPEAKALLDRFELGPRDLPIVLCPNGFDAAIRARKLARCIGLLIARCDQDLRRSGRRRWAGGTRDGGVRGIEGPRCSCGLPRLRRTGGASRAGTTQRLPPASREWR